MAAVSQPLTTRSPFEADQHRFANGTVKRMPILSAAEPIRADSGSGSGSGNGDPMDVSQPVTAPAANMGPPATSSPNTDRSPAELPPPLPPSHHHSPQAANNHENTVNGGGGTPSLGAQAAAQQPKIVQTAFIHKFMLEDQSIQHLISWSTTNDSFVMSPSTEFSKVLASYFKHTNISSFVRQLNMYGFHKVSDVFHTGSPDSPLWEFKHGAGNFKRGDLAGLREIKRRASRHALIHRDSFPSGPAATAKIPPQHPTALSLDQQPPPLPEPFDARLARLEMNQQELFLHIAHTEDAYTAISLKCRALLDGLTKVSHWGQELSTHLLTLIPDPENPIHRDVCALRQDMARHVDQLRGLDEPAPPLQYQPAPHESLFPNKPSFFPPPSSSSSTTMTTAAALEPPTMSPRQRAFDLDSRRPSLGPRPPSFRAPPHLSSPRRYGSIGAVAAAAAAEAVATREVPPYRTRCPNNSPLLHHPHPISREGTLPRISGPRSAGPRSSRLRLLLRARIPDPHGRRVQEWKDWVWV
ncbi:hypothetical protein M433DRAFT_461248 [Acidomyces richmondensis BFW]|nr:hypothetical protein M433DRAFT_461248 [Acidomyces richmondensis BFW]